MERDLGRETVIESEYHSITLTKAPITSQNKAVTIVFAICYIIAFFNLILWTARVTASDPTAPVVSLERLARQAKENKMAELDFNPNNYSFYCDVCDTHVLKNTKHCRRCNRCTYEFDHHCVWVSNDIGLHNYVDFMRMLTALMFTIVFQLIICINCLLDINDLPDDVKVGVM